jgi:hypothetical protein
MKRVAVTLLCTVVPATAVLADEIDRIDQLTQAEFRQVSEDLGAALSYKAIVPAETLGIAGFDIGVAVSATKIKNTSAWDTANSGSTSSTLIVPKIFVHKGLPLGIDLGAFYSSVPDSNISLWGAELRYALVEGGTATPALGLRGTYSKLSGVEQLELETKGIEMTVSKGFANITPYAGVGRIWTTSTPVGVGLAEEEFGQGKYYVGANINLAILNIAVEGDKTGDTTTYGAKFGWRF